MTTLKALHKLMRLKSTTLDQHQRFVSKIRQRVENVENEIKDLKGTLQQEQLSASESLEGSLALAQYSTSVLQKLERLGRLHHEAQAQLEKEQEKLKNLYADLKAVEKIVYETEKKTQETYERKEQSTLDDLYNYRKKSSF